MYSLFVLRIALMVLFVYSSVSHSVAAQEATPDASTVSQHAIAFYPETTGLGSYIAVELEPGSAETVNVILGNAGSIEQTLRTYAVPAITAVNGGFNLADHGVEPDEVTGWIDYPETKYTFAPSEGVSIPVNISVPLDTPAGEYVAGLAAEQADPFEVPGTENFDQRVRWAVPVLVVVPGERVPGVELNSATLENRNGTLIANVGVTNTGNVIVRPEGEARLLDPDGAVVGVSRFKLDSVYVGTETTFVVAWQNIPISDSYSIEVNLSVEDATLSVSRMYPDVVPFLSDDEAGSATPVVTFPKAELIPLTKDTPPSMLQLTAEIENNGDPIENARVAMVTYQDGVEIDRYPILQAVTIGQGATPVQARYALPGGFTNGTYTFAVTIELGSADTQTILVAQKLDYEITVP